MWLAWSPSSSAAAASCSRPRRGDRSVSALAARNTHSCRWSFISSRRSARCRTSAARPTSRSASAEYARPTAASEMFFISTSTSTARSRSLNTPLEGTGGSQRGAAASSWSRLIPAGDPRRNSTSPGSRIRSPSTCSIIHERSRRTATTRMPHWTGNSRSLSGRCAMWEPSRTHTRWLISSALDRSDMSSSGMPNRCVTSRVMSTDALAIPSIEEITCNTDAIPSASAGRRTAMMQTSRMSCTRSFIRSSS